MALVLWLLTAVLVIDCLLLGLLILIQLPKKEAGMGTAFGGGATDALFGSGTGDVLTKATKYAAGVFLVLALLISVVLSKQHHSAATSIQQQLNSDSGTPAAPAAPAPTAPTAPAPAAPANQLNIPVPQQSAPATSTTATPAAPAPATPAPSTPAPAPTPK